MISLRVRSATAARPAVARRSVVVRATPASTVQTVKNSVEAIKDAEEVCANGNQSECAAAWDTVERVAAEEEFQARKRLATRRRASELACASRAALDKLAENDPLEKFCAESPDADECRVYE